MKGVYTTPFASPAPSTAPGSPATGDESNLVLWVVVLAAGSAALVGSFLIQRKKEQ
nr:LPXTG cell wall anchor domain-containing protein [Fournierella massiliensis]